VEIEKGPDYFLDDRIFFFVGWGFISALRAFKVMNSVMLITIACLVLFPNIETFEMMRFIVDFQ